jgi:hypothetical protein
VSRFIAIIHGWHVHSNGFNVHELDALSLAEAEKEACWLKGRREGGGWVRPMRLCGRSG